jgi:hypothetical protein
MISYEFVQQALEMRASMQKLFMVGVFGDMLGVPILPPYYGLRLLPWVVPEIDAWKREVLRERELGSSHEHHLPAAASLKESDIADTSFIDELQRNGFIDRLYATDRK